MNPKRIIYNTHVGSTADDFGGGNLVCTLYACPMLASWFTGQHQLQSTLAWVNALIIAQYFHI
jgi:hypothetical protein